MAFVPQTYSFEEVLTSSKMNQVDTNIDEVRKFHKGSTAPASPVAGTHWIDDTTAGKWLRNVYDGADWIAEAVIDSVNNIIVSAPAQAIEIQNVTSAVASVDFVTGIDSKHEAYLLTFANVQPATDATGFWLRVSQDAGSTFKAGATDYSWSTSGAETSTGAARNAGDGEDNEMQLTGGAFVTNSASHVMSGYVYIFKPTSDKFKEFMWQIRYTNSNLGGSESLNGAGQFDLNTTAIDGLRLLFSSGNIAIGDFALYGLGNIGVN